MIKNHLNNIALTLLLIPFITSCSHNDSANEKIGVCDYYSVSQDEFITELKLSSIFDHVIFGHYEQDGNKQTSEPIEWLIISKQDNQVLLLSKYALESMEVKAYNPSEDIGWSNCTIRCWLNDEFYLTAFDKDEQKLILNIENNISDSYELYKPLEDYYNELLSEQKHYTFGSDGTNSTSDKVFLLDWTELRDSIGIKYPNFGTTNKFIECHATTYALSQGIDMSEYNFSDKKDTRCAWLLRTPGTSSEYLATISPNGNLYNDDVKWGTFGIRPAIWISIN